MLANERVSLSQGGLRWGHGPTVSDLVDAVRDRGDIERGALTERLLSAYIEGEILRFHRLARVRPGQQEAGARLVTPKGACRSARTFDAAFVDEYPKMVALVAAGGKSDLCDR
ncbi:MAG: hypothetical protein ACI9C1_000613 [Candidatus Aldehydirespiratoraceae bacterium]|jgi:hypothetical protein